MIFYLIFSLLSVHAEITINKTLVIPDSNLLNQVTYYQITESKIKAKGAIILLNGTGMGIETYMHSDSGKVEDSLVGFLIQQGLEVYGLTPRIFNYPDHCNKDESTYDGEDCLSCAGWGMEQELKDVDRLASMAEGRNKNIYIGGFSLGALETFYAINKWPQRFQKALVWEGMVVTDTPSILKSNQEGCRNFEKLIKSGKFVSSKDLGLIKKLSAKALARPQSINPMGIFVGGSLFSTNLEVFVKAATLNLGKKDPTWGASYRYLTAKDDENFKYVSLERGFREMQNFSDVVSVPLMRDYTCTLAKPNAPTEVFLNLGQYKGDVLSVQAEFGMGKFAEPSLTILQQAKITRLFLTGQAHADLLFSTDLQREYLFSAISQWLRP